MNSTVRRLTAAGTAVAALGLGAVAWASSPASAASAVIPRCVPGQLAVWVNVGSASGAAGSVYYNLDFTNTSGTTCHLYGYPGVTAVNGNGAQLGDAAARNSTVPASYVNIALGASAHAILRYVDVVATSPECKATPAALLRVFPPGDTGARYAFFDLPSCTATGQGYLQIERVQQGA
jgi:hypothetical protein